MSHHTIHHMHTWALHGTPMLHMPPSHPSIYAYRWEVSGRGWRWDVRGYRLEFRGYRLEVRGERL